jgi:hypothetical protein
MAASAIAGVPLARLGFDFPQCRPVGELAAREHGRVGGPLSRRPDISTDILTAALVAFVVGWVTVGDYLLPSLASKT